MAAELVTGIAEMASAGALFGADLMDRWREWGPLLWLVTAVLAAAWFAALGAAAVRLRPNRVKPGPATLDLPGDEAPAVVNLITNGWELGHESVAATLIDLAGRGHLAIDTLGGRTTVRVAKPPDVKAALPTYDEMVFTHVATLANRTDAGLVPAEALTTGPDATSKRWWRRFESAVIKDARARGFSRARWPAPVKAAFVAAAVPVAIALGLAVTTLHVDGVGEAIQATVDDVVPPTTPTDVTVLEGDIPPGTINGGTAPGATTTPSTGPGATTPGATAPPTTTASSGSNDAGTDDEDIVGFGFFMALLGGAGLSALVGRLGAERDTPAGRAEAARWLGVREMLGDNPVFAEQPAAGVAIWDKHLGHGVALGVAHGAVRDLPLGTESDTEAWSHVGGRWRVVRVRYPRRFRPGWGAAPSIVTLWAVLLLAAGGATLHYLPQGVDALRTDAAQPGVEQDGTPQGTPVTVPTEDLLPWAESAEPWARAAAVVALAVGGWFAVLGVGDLVRKPRVVEGIVVRHRQRGKIKRTEHGTKDKRVWFVAVDDGTTDRIRAWRTRRDPHVHQGNDVQVTATPVLGHVTDVLVRRDPPPPPPPQVAGAPAGPPDELAGLQRRTDDTPGAPDSSPCPTGG
jgi:hypothetical protein